jgi:DNA-binding MarR family transcriptional regulator
MTTRATSRTVGSAKEAGGSAIKRPTRPSTDDVDSEEITRIRSKMFAQTDIWYGFRIIVLGNFYSSTPSARVLQDFGLSRDEMGILSSLHHWGGLTANIICALTGRPKNSISRGVIRLVRDGLITSRVDEADRRRSILTIEASGEDVYEKAAAIFRDREEEMFGCLTKKERNALDETLRKLLQNWGRRLTNGAERYITEY